MWAISYGCSTIAFPQQECEVVSSGPVSLVANEVVGPFWKKSAVKMFYLLDRSTVLTIDFFLNGPRTSFATSETGPEETTSRSFPQLGARKFCRPSYSLELYQLLVQIPISYLVAALPTF